MPLPELDADGHLLDASQWTPELATKLAMLEGIALSNAHLQVVEVLRGHWQRYGELPGVRMLLRALREQHGPALGSSLVLYRLFPDAPLRQACRVGGLPKPVSCV